MYLSSEWSPAGLNGRADFQVASMKWSIECLREGDRLQEQVARFELGGRFEWITKGYINEYDLVHFRISDNKTELHRSIMKVVSKWIRLVGAPCAIAHTLKAIVLVHVLSMIAHTLRVPHSINLLNNNIF